MPSERNVDAPVNIWIGPERARVVLGSLNADWAAPALAVFSNRIVNLDDLCAADPPSNPGFDLADLAAQWGTQAMKDAAQDKLEQVTNRRLWEDYCHFTDSTPHPEPTALVPPANLPVGFQEDPQVDRLRDLWIWVRWMRQEFVPRSYHGGEGALISGDGQMTFPLDTTGAWDVWPAGYQTTLVESPDYTPRDGVPYTIWWDLGWVSMGTDEMLQAPVRVQRTQQLFYPSVPKSNTFSWHLAPGVTLQVDPLYPDTIYVPEA